MWERVRERKLVQWALAYLAGAWLLLEVAEMVGGAFGWPAAVQRALIALAVVGLGVVLVLAWYHGERGRQRVSGAELLILATLVVIAGALTLRTATPGGGEEPANTGDAATASATNGDTSQNGGDLLPSTDLPTGPSIAVLPFDNLSADPDHAYFALAVSDEITHALQQVSGLRVINRASASRYADTDLSLREIGRALGVSRLLSGSVQRQGDEVRILAQLVDADSESQLWSDRYLQRLDNAFQVQAAIAEQIATALEGEFDSSVERRITAGGTESTVAYDLFLRGREIWFRDTWGPDALRRAAAVMSSALEIDPGFSRARADLSSIYVDLANFSGPTVVDTALAIAEQAVAEEPEMGDGHGSLCYALDNLGRMDEALAACNRAVELAPGSSDALWNLGMVLSSLGRTAEAVPWLEQALVLAPDLPGLRGAVGYLWSTMGDSLRAHAWFEYRRQAAPDLESEAPFFDLYWDRGHVESAETVLESMMAMDDAHWLTLRAQAELEMYRGDWNAAITSLEAYHQIQAPEWNPPMQLALAHLEAGNRAQADSLAAFAEDMALRFRARGDRGDWIPRTLASVATVRGNVDEAVRHLETAWELGMRGGDALFHESHRRRLRDHPGFLEQMRAADATDGARALRLTTVPNGLPPGP